jgi:transcriptional regulator of heat shock response
MAFLKSDTGPLASVPLWLLINQEVSHGAIRLYAMLSARWCDREGVANPSRHEVAEVLNCSLPTLDRWLKQLVDAHAVEVVHQKINSKQYLANLYQLKRIHHTAGGNTGVTTLDTSVNVGGVENSNVGGQQSELNLSTNTKHISSNQLVLSTKELRSDFAKFETFWSRYPRHERKQAARDQWSKLKIEHNENLYRQVMDGLTAYLRVWESEQREQKYIVLAHRWLKEKQFEDAPVIAETKAVNKSTQQMIDSTNRFLERRRTVAGA